MGRPFTFTKKLLEELIVFLGGRAVGLFLYPSSHVLKTPVKKFQETVRSLVHCWGRTPRPCSQGSVGEWRALLNCALFRQTADGVSQRFTDWATSTIFKMMVEFAVKLIHRPTAKYINPRATADTAENRPSIIPHFPPVAHLRSVPTLTGQTDQFRDQHQLPLQHQLYIGSQSSSLQ